VLIIAGVQFPTHIGGNMPDKQPDQKKRRASMLDADLKKIRDHLTKHGPHKGTAPALAKAIGIPVERLGRAAQHTRRGDFRKENGWWVPPAGRGKECVWKVEEKKPAAAKKPKAAPARRAPAASVAAPLAAAA
jgi:hypothetical protein